MNNKKRVVLLAVAVTFAAALVGTVQAGVTAGVGGESSRLRSSSKLPGPQKGVPLKVGVPQKDEGVVETAIAKTAPTEDGFGSGATASQ